LAHRNGSYGATARFNRDDPLDRSSEKAGGCSASSKGEIAVPSPLLVTSDQKIVVVGSMGAPSAVLFRYLPDGTPDRRFGRDGMAEFFDATGWGAALGCSGPRRPRRHQMAVANAASRRRKAHSRERQVRT
jgi:hypothetical protein